jgi:hypothetical protein
MVDFLNKLSHKTTNPSSNQIAVPNNLFYKISSTTVNLLQVFKVSMVSVAVLHY